MLAVVKEIQYEHKGGLLNVSKTFLFFASAEDWQPAVSILKIRANLLNPPSSA
jgi:hypothetical protein